MQMLPGMIPILVRVPGVISPGQLGPMSRAPRARTKGMARLMCITGIPSVMQTMSGRPAAPASMVGEGRQAGARRFDDGGGRGHGRHVDDRRVGAGLPHRVGHGVEDGDLVLEALPPLPGRHPGDHLGAVLQHLAGVEGAFPSGDSLDQKASVGAGPDAHAAPRASLTTRSTAWSISLSAVIPTSLRMRIASASLVPVSRMTIGTLTLNWRVAATMPLATSSVRVMPPKMLKRIAFTLGS